MAKCIVYSYRANYEVDAHSSYTRGLLLLENNHCFINKEWLEE